MANPSDIETIVRQFVSRVQQAVLAESTERVRSALSSELGDPPTRNVPRKAAPKVPSTAAKPAASKAGRKIQLSAKGLATRQLQGKYMGLLRGLPANVRARVKTYAHENGVAAALKYGSSLK
jgi:hypothetical protein